MRARVSVCACRTARRSPHARALLIEIGDLSRAQAWEAAARWIVLFCARGVIVARMIVHVQERGNERGVCG